MKRAQNRFIRICRAFFRSVLCLFTLYLLFMLGRGAYNLVNSFSVPFGFSSAAGLVISSVVILLFFTLGLLVIIRFFTPVDPE